MHAHIRAAVDYLHAAGAAMGLTEPERHEHRRIQKDHLVATLAQQPVTLEDATAALRFLAEPGPMGTFSQEDRQEIAHAIQSKVATTATSHSVVGTRTQVQTHLYMHNYLCEIDWSTLPRDDIAIDQKMLTVIRRSHEIGLKYPSEPTMVSIIGLLAVASKMHLSAEQGYAWVRQYKGFNDALRTKYQTTPTTMRTFPENVSDFQSLHPTSYTLENPPVAPRVSVQDSKNICALVPARRSSKLLQPTQLAVPQGATMPQLNPSDFFQQMMQACMGGGMGFGCAADMPM